MLFDDCRKVLKRIRRANTDWWINEKAIVADNGKTYIVYCTDVGEVHIRETDNLFSNVPGKDFCLTRLNCNYSDEHNSPSLCILSDGRMIVSYAGHNSEGALRYRITEKPYDIYSFGEEISLVYGGSVTYAQMFEMKSLGEIWLFTRVNGVTWQFCKSNDGGNTFTSPKMFIHSDKGGLYYANFRKQTVPAANSQFGMGKSGAKDVVERLFFAIYGHPIGSKDHTIRAGFITLDGNITDMNGTILMSLNSHGDLLDINSLPAVYESPEGTTVRLLTVSPTEPCRIGLAAFTYEKDAEAIYHVASYRDGKWQLSEPIVGSGEFLANETYDGSQTYVGGFEFYYGVGDAGLHPTRIVPTNTDRIFTARKNSGGRYVIESYLSVNCGKNYELEEVIREVPEGLKAWRPTVPIHAQDNMPVYWHEGTYRAHTGGWHCDVVMYVEHDE